MRSKRAIAQEQWRLKNPEKVKANKQRYYAKHRVEVLARVKRYYYENREARQQYGRDFHALHKDKLNSQSLSRRRNRPEWYLWSSARNRAKKRGLEFTLLPEDVKIPLICPVLGIPLQIVGGKVTAHSPTLDRVDNSKGYTKENTLVVSFRANNLKSDATFEELRQLADFYSDKEEVKYA